MSRRLLACPAALLLLVGCNRGDAPQIDMGQSVPLTSPAFADGAAIPKHYTGDGENRSPPLQWSAAPAGVKRYALICDDPDAPGKTWVHWVIWNIPGDAKGLPEGEPGDASMRDGTRQGKNDFGGVGYGGPDPPAGKAHRYFFRLYALDASLELPEDAGRGQLEQAMTGHIIGHGQLMGTYQK